MQKGRPLLSIAIPTYNGRKTIRNLFDLLLPQVTDDVELLVSDNCSTDGTTEIIEEYKTRYPFIKHVRNEKNIGPDANFLQCFRLASGKYLWNISDDDVVIEGAISKVIQFLKNYPAMGLIYVETVDFRGKYTKVVDCQYHEPRLNDSVLTKDKCEFYTYAGYYWGFLSSFITYTDNFISIENPEQYYGTYWLQSYLHAACAAGNGTYLGLIKGPCLGAGIYVNNPNYDSSLVNGVYYLKLIDYMIKNCGFDKKQLYKQYGKRICHLSRHDILKEKAAGIRKINKKQLFKVTNKFPEAWMTVYPLFVFPSMLCKWSMKLYRKHKNLSSNIEINRPE